jgi:hypothetical protein
MTCAASVGGSRRSIRLPTFFAVMFQKPRCLTDMRKVNHYYERDMR